MNTDNSDEEFRTEGREGVKKKAIIFGANGQDGHYLSELCDRQGCDVTRVSRSKHAGTGYVRGDVAIQGEVWWLIDQLRPDLIFHLAANSTTDANALPENHRTIGDGTLNILRTVHQVSPQTKVFLAGSCLQLLNDGRPMSEENQLVAGSGYAAVRNYSMFLGRYYRSLGLKVYFGFLFHHESPFRKDRHVSRIIAGAARKAAAGDAVMLEMDDLQACREWTFAGDTVEAIWKLVNQERVFEACIGTGHPRTVAEFAHACFDAVGLNWTDHVTERPDMVNGRRAKQISANPGLIRSIGWQPRTRIQDLAEMMVQG
jgi:GDPmannose 4,6-dehydratase